MDLSALRAFTAVAHHSSFSKAAKELFLTQPAVSKRIKALEDELSTQLFDRVAGSVELTEAGAILQQSARRILAEVTDAEEQIRSLDASVTGRLRIGTSHHIGIHRLPSVLRHYTSEFPDVELDLQFLDSELACEQVEIGQLELAIVTLPQNAPDNLVTTELWPDPLVLVTPIHHPLTRRRSVSPALLAQHPAVLPAHGTITRSILENCLSSVDIDINIALETNYLETIKVMVSVGLGWSVLPRSMLNAELAVIKVKGFDMQRSLGAVQQKNRTLSRAAERFLQTIN